MKNSWLWDVNGHLLPAKSWCFEGHFSDSRCVSSYCILTPDKLHHSTEQLEDWDLHCQPFSAVIYLFLMTDTAQTSFSRGVNGPCLGSKNTTNMPEVKVLQDFFYCVDKRQYIINYYWSFKCENVIATNTEIDFFFNTISGSHFWTDCKNMHIPISTQIDTMCMTDSSSTSWIKPLTL